MVGLGININAEGEGKLVIYTEHPIGDKSPSKIFHKSASIMSVCYKGFIHWNLAEIQNAYILFLLEYKQ